VALAWGAAVFSTSAARGSTTALFDTLCVALAIDPTRIGVHSGPRSGALQPGIASA
jgi:hypothetical protein